MHIEKDAYISQQIKQMNTFYEELSRLSLKKDKKIDEIISLNSTYNYTLIIRDRENKVIYSTARHGEKVVNFDDYSADAVPEYVKKGAFEEITLRKIALQDGQNYYIFVKWGIKSADSVLAYTNRNMIIILVCYMLICCVSLVILVNRKIKPIMQISEITKHIAEKDYSVRYKGKVTKDEIGVLAKNVNKMADTIEENINSLNNYQFLLKEDLNYMTKYYEVRKDVVSQITHELKTPLAVISSQVEMMNCSHDEKKKQFYYNSTMEEIEKMSSMIKKILNYSITEHGIFDGEVKEVNISSFIKNLCEKRKNHILSSQFDFETDIQENCIITINETHIIHVFDNYISNALNHTVAGGKISVKLKKLEDKIRFSVYNEGSHILDENKDEIWNKFFTSYGNSKENTDIHAGIGLFIVKEISVLERTSCGFENHKNGVEFWFDFNCSN